MDPFRIVLEATFHRVGSDLQHTIRSRLFGFAIRIVKLVRQQRLNLIRLFNSVLDLLAKLFDFLLPFLHSVDQLLAFVVAIEPIGVLIVLFFIFQLLRKRLLFLLNFLSLISHLPHLIVELPGSLFLEIVTQIFQFPFCPRPFGGGFGKITFLQSLRRSLHVLASLFHLLHLIGLLSLYFFHPLLQFVGVPQHLLLFFFESFQLLFQFFFFLFRLRFLKCRLQFLDAFIKVVLSLSQFFQSAEDLPILTLLLSLFAFFLSLSFLLVAIFLFSQLHLLKLPLPGRLRATR